MEQTLLTFSLFLFLTNVFGQKNEFEISLNSGLFSFSGASAKRTSSINFSDQTNSGYTNNPWGSMNAICYGISLNAERVTKKNFIIGLDLGYEILKSKISIDRIDGYNGVNTYQLSATGETYLESKFINFNPFIGYRLTIKEISFDLVGGFDFGHCFTTKEIGNATDSNGKKYTTSEDRKTIKNDFRPRIQFSSKYKKFGLYIGYSFGQTNYLSGMDGMGTFESYSRIIRFGVSYQIK